MFKGKYCLRFLHCPVSITMPIMLYDWPEDQKLIGINFWLPSQAARAWGCSDRAVRRWMRAHPAQLVLLRLRHSGGLFTHKVCMRAGQARAAGSASTQEGALVSLAQRRAAATALARQALASAPVVRYMWPRDRETVHNTYWQPSQAAKAWGCSYYAARRWMLLHPQHAVVVELLHRNGTVTRRNCLLAGQARTSSARGNPDWRDSSCQAELVSRRWKRRLFSPPEGVPWD